MKVPDSVSMDQVVTGLLSVLGLYLVVYIGPAVCHAEVKKAVGEGAGVSIIAMIGSMLHANVAYRKVNKNVHPLRHFLVSYFLYAYPTALIGSFVLGQPFTMIGNAQWLKYHTIIFALVNYCPSDIFFQVMSVPTAFMTIDVLAWLAVIGGINGTMRSAADAAGATEYFVPAVGIVVAAFGPMIRDWEANKLKNCGQAIPHLRLACLVGLYIWYKTFDANFEVVYLAYFISLYTFAQHFDQAFDVTVPIGVLWRDFVPKAHCA